MVIVQPAHLGLYGGPQPLHRGVRAPGLVVTRLLPKVVVLERLLGPAQHVVRDQFLITGCWCWFPWRSPGVGEPAGAEVVMVGDQPEQLGAVHLDGGELVITVTTDTVATVTTVHLDRGELVITATVTNDTVANVSTIAHVAHVLLDGGELVITVATVTTHTVVHIGTVHLNGGEGSHFF